MNEIRITMINESHSDDNTQSGKISKKLLNTFSYRIRDLA